MGIICTHGLGYSTGSDPRCSQRGFTSNTPSHGLLSNDDGGIYRVSEAPSNTPTASQYWLSHSDPLSTQYTVAEAEPYVSFISPAQNAAAIPLANSTLSEINKASPQSLVVVRGEDHLKTCIRCWAYKKKVYVDLSLRLKVYT